MVERRTVKRRENPTAPRWGGAPSDCWFRAWLELHDVLRRRAFLGLHDFELHALAFGQRLEPFTPHRGVMHEAVLAAVLGRDEAEAPGLVQPLHGTGDACHLCGTPSRSRFARRAP